MKMSAVSDVDYVKLLSAAYPNVDRLAKIIDNCLDILVKNSDV